MWVKETIIRREPDRANPVAPERGNKSTVPPFAKLLWTSLVVLQTLIRVESKLMFTSTIRIVILGSSSV